MKFQWDQDKAASNLLKHGIPFSAAERAFADPFAVVLADGTVDHEERLQLIGFAEDLLLLLVVHTYREEYGKEFIRIISARRATARERRIYRDAQLRS